MVPSKAVFKVDPTGKVRYATLSLDGKEARVRVPLHVFNLKDVEKQKYFMEELIKELKAKFKRDYGIAI